MNGDTPIKRKTFLEMSEVEQIAFIEELRERRMNPINTYQEIKQAMIEKRQSKLKDKLDKELVMFEKQLETVNKNLDKLQDKANKIRALKIQLDLN